MPHMTVWQTAEFWKESKNASPAVKPRLTTWSTFSLKKTRKKSRKKNRKKIEPTFFTAHAQILNADWPSPPWLYLAFFHCSFLSFIIRETKKIRILAKKNEKFENFSERTKLWLIEEQERVRTPSPPHSRELFFYKIETKGTKCIFCFFLTCHHS